MSGAVGSIGTRGRDSWMVLDLWLMRVRSQQFWQYPFFFLTKHHGLEIHKVCLVFFEEIHLNPRIPKTAACLDMPSIPMSLCAMNLCRGPSELISKAGSWGLLRGCETGMTIYDA